MKVNDKGYIQTTKSPIKNHWLVKYSSAFKKDSGHLNIGNITLPKKYVGKHIRIKIEVVC